MLMSHLGDFFVLWVVTVWGKETLSGGLRETGVSGEYQNIPPGVTMSVVVYCRTLGRPTVVVVSMDTKPCSNL